MSPDLRVGREFVESFPRVSGDEPTAWAALNATMAFSPRERG